MRLIILVQTTIATVIDYFSEADFMLGMTATPERTDNFDIFTLFDHNIAYEIRLQRPSMRICCVRSIIMAYTNSWEQTHPS